MLYYTNDVIIVMWLILLWFWCWVFLILRQFLEFSPWVWGELEVEE